MKNEINMSNNLNEEILSIIHNRSNQPRIQFSLSHINFERIHNNLENNRKERNKESNIKQIDNKQIILDLRYKVRKELYKIIDGNKNEILNNNININININNSDINDNNINLLGKKRNSEIPIIDLTED